MVINEILGNLKSYADKGRTIDTVWIDWYEQDKKLLKKNTASGEEVGIRVAVPLKEGDILYADDKRIVAVAILPCELVTVEVETMQEMGRLCFELGNRHLSLSIREHQVVVPYDEPTFLYLEKLGFHPQKRVEKFLDYTVCHGHGDGHSHGEVHTHGDIHQHSVKHARRDSNLHDEKHACGDSDSHDEKHACGDSDSHDEKHVCGDSNSYGEKHACGDSDSYGEKHTHRDNDSHGEKHACRDSDSYGEKHARRDSNLYGEEYVCRNSDSCGEEHTHRNSHSHHIKYEHE